MSPTGNGETGKSPTSQENNNARLSQFKREIGDKPKARRESLVQAMQANKDRAAKLAQGQPEIPASDTPQSEIPLNRGTPAQVAAKEDLLNLGSGERAKLSMKQGITELQQRFQAAMESGDENQANQIKENIIRLEKSYRDSD